MTHTRILGAKYIYSNKRNERRKKKGVKGDISQYVERKIEKKLQQDKRKMMNKKPYLPIYLRINKQLIVLF